MDLNFEANVISVLNATFPFMSQK